MPGVEHLFQHASHPVGRQERQLEVDLLHLVGLDPQPRVVVPQGGVQRSTRRIPSRRLT
jgi:hypothetical protein